MRVALVQPPSCDPTAPYLAVPMLTGFLRREGISVLPVDANIEAYDALLSPGPLEDARDRVEARLAALSRRPSLRHEERLAYASLTAALADAHAAPLGIARAKAVLRDEARFFDPAQYGRAVATIDAALRALSAAYHPLHLDFTAYRTPFGLLDPSELAGDLDEDPFARWVHDVLAPRLREARPDVIGLSVCFPGQLQPAYAFAARLRRELPGVHLTVGGPGVTQMLVRLTGQRLARALGPFDTAVLYEGERTLTELARSLDEKRPLREVPNLVVRDKLLGARAKGGHGMEDMKALPAPDFDGLPLDLYLSPRLVLPYDPTRGCYWGKCTFCHYGLAEVGTAKYRERHVGAVVEHLRALSSRHGTRHFYFSQDSVAPKTAVKLAEAIAAAGLDVRWATDLKPERYLTKERARALRAGGAVACALGVESASPRVLELIDKGAPIDVVSDVIDNLHDAGIAPEAMCFTDFPTETTDEALATLRFLRERRDRVSGYIVGEFGLTHGALVAQDPARYGIAETWGVEGDVLGLGLFFRAERPWKTDEGRARVDGALGRLSEGWALRPYPWAGAVATAHTVLHYDRFGPGALRELARRPASDEPFGARTLRRALAFDPLRCAEAAEGDARIWAHLVNDARKVGRSEYAALAEDAPRERRRETVVEIAPGGFVEHARDAGRPRPKRAPRDGRRPDHATSRATARDRGRRA